MLIDSHTRHHNSNRGSLKFEAKWLLDKDFMGLVIAVWSTYNGGSYAYQLARKTNILKQEIKKRKTDNGNGRKQSWEMI